VKKITALFRHDYNIDGGSFHRPAQPIFSLICTMLMWLGLWICIDAGIRFVYADITLPVIYKSPWMAIWFGMPGAVMWWIDKVHYQDWLASRRELPMSEAATARSTGAHA
jgi:hypothetical protein